LSRGIDIDPPTLARLATEEHVFPDGQSLDELKMLVHETDGTAALDRAFVGCERSECDVGERSLAGAVLADQTDDCPRRDIEIDPIDRDEIAETFDDSAQRECRCRGHYFSGTGANAASSSRVDGGLIFPSMMAWRMRAMRAMLAWPICTLVYAKSVNPTPSSRSPSTM